MNQLKMTGDNEKLVVKRAELNAQVIKKRSNWDYVLAKWEGLQYPKSGKTCAKIYEKAQVVKTQNYIFDEMDPLQDEMGVELMDCKGNLSICALNVNGLDDMKIDSILWYAIKTVKDLIFLNDTRLLARESKRMEGVVR